jgi:hypothetical protein
LSPSEPRKGESSLRLSIILHVVTNDAELAKFGEVRAEADRLIERAQAAALDPLRRVPVVPPVLRAATASVEVRAQPRRSDVARTGAGRLKKVPSCLLSRLVV